MSMADCQCAVCKKRYRLISKAIAMCDCRPRIVERYVPSTLPRDFDEKLVAAGKRINDE